ncbi:MAG: hypothetical protein RL328_2135 [Acidobacteriota bacterium]|jgi:hypothetical protein
MRSSLQLGAALLWAALGVYAQDRPDKVFLLEDADKHEWCAYTDHQRWETEREARNWVSVGAVDFDKGNVIRVFLTVPADSGEWVVSDEYAVNDSSVIETVTRYVDHTKGGFFEKSVYFVEETQAVLISRDYKTPDETDLPKDPDAKQSETSHTYRGHVLPDLKVWLHLMDFPFSEFLQKDHTEVWRTGRTCSASER